MTNRQRAVMLGLAAVVAVIAVVFLNTSDTSEEQDVIDTRTEQTTSPPATTTAETPTETTAAPEAKPRIPTVVIRDGKPVGGVERFRFRKGSTIRLVVRSDTAGEIHIHGYDVHRDVEAGGTVRFSIPADVDGRFEVEIEETQTLIAEIEVRP